MRIVALVTLVCALAATPLAAQSPAPAPKQTPPKATPPATAEAVPAPKSVAPAAQPPAAKPAASQPQPASPPAKAEAPMPAATAGEARPPAAPQAPAPEAYTYRAEGRRDPFQTLAPSGAAAAALSRKGEGPAGLAVADISVRGVMQSRGALVAMIMGPDNKTYIVHQGDKLLDGTIRTITPQGLVVVQEVNDPLSLVKQREIRKLLRSLEDAKE
jgi:Tfp pilus assembly protein PilP